MYELALKELSRKRGWLLEISYMTKKGMVTKSIKYDSFEIAVKELQRAFEFRKNVKKYVKKAVKYEIDRHSI